MVDGGAFGVERVWFMVLVHISTLNVSDFHQPEPSPRPSPIRWEREPKPTPSGSLRRASATRHQCLPLSRRTGEGVPRMRHG